VKYGLNDFTIGVLPPNRLLKSCCSSCSSGYDFMCLKHFVSSAKRKASLLLIELGKLFINMRSVPKILLQIQQVKGQNKSY